MMLDGKAIELLVRYKQNEISLKELELQYLRLLKSAPISDAKLIVPLERAFLALESLDWTVGPGSQTVHNRTPDAVSKELDAIVDEIASQAT